jgi:hypothetical protein
MSDEPKRDLPARRVERRLIKIAGAALRENSANPERIGCPDPSAVEAAVRRRLNFPGLVDVVDHIATCAPCFEQYNRQRQRLRIRNAGTAMLGCVVLLVLGFLWLHGPAKGPNYKEPIAKQVSAPVLIATLDYRSWTARLDLTIMLPIGTEDGGFTVQFRTSTNESVAEATGTATWDGTAEALKIRTDLRDVPAGRYNVAIQSRNSSVRLYPLVLE